MDYLEHLAQLLGCAYLSDLRYRPTTPPEAERILSEKEEYPLSDYVAAARYILGRDFNCTTSKAAKEAIVKHLKR